MDCSGKIDEHGDHSITLSPSSDNSVICSLRKSLIFVLAPGCQFILLKIKLDFMKNL